VEEALAMHTDDSAVLHRNTRSFVADFAAALLAAVLLALGVAGVLPGGWVVALMPAAALLAWTATQPLSALVHADGSATFTTPFTSRRVDAGRFRFRWLSRPYQADGVLLLLVRGWPLWYRPTDYEDPRRLADAVAVLLSTRRPVPQRGVDSAARMAANFAADSAISASAVEPATSPQPAKSRTSRRSRSIWPHRRAIPNSPSPRASNHPTGPA
jgi:hypothetical protein